MGKISNVLYEEIDPSIYSNEEAGEYFWYQNMMGLNERIDDEYIEYESRQMKIRNKLIKESIPSSKLVNPMRMLGSSSLKQKVVLICEY